MAPTPLPTPPPANPTPANQPGWLGRSFGKKCPSCRKRGYAYRGDTYTLGSTVETVRERRVAHHRDLVFRPTGNTSYVVDTPVTRTVYANSFACRSCHYVWIEKFTR